MMQHFLDLETVCPEVYHLVGLVPICEQTAKAIALLDTVCVRTVEAEGPDYPAFMVYEPQQKN